MGQAWASQFECKTSIEGHAHKSGLRELRIVRIPLVYVIYIYIYIVQVWSRVPQNAISINLCFLTHTAPQSPSIVHPRGSSVCNLACAICSDWGEQRSIWQWAPSVCQKRSQSAIKCSLALRQHSNIASPQVHKHRQHSHLRSSTHVSRNGSKKRTVPASIASRVKRRKAQEWPQQNSNDPPPLKTPHFLWISLHILPDSINAWFWVVPCVAIRHYISTFQVQDSFRKRQVFRNDPLLSNRPGWNMLKCIRTEWSFIGPFASN